jgi:hypothetical protein
LDLSTSILAPLPGISLVVSSIYDPISNTVEVYYETGKHIEQLSFNGTGWNKQDLTAATGAPPSI